MAEAIKIEDIEERVVLIGVSEQDGDDAEDSVHYHYKKIKEKLNYIYPDE